MINLFPAMTFPPDDGLTVDVRRVLLFLSHVIYFEMLQILCDFSTQDSWYEFLIVHVIFHHTIHSSFITHMMLHVEKCITCSDAPWPVFHM